MKDKLRGCIIVSIVMTGALALLWFIFAENIDLIYDQLPKKYRDRIIMGIALYNQDELSASDKIKYSKITRFKGISLFSYNVFLENQNYMNQLIINP